MLRHAQQTALDAFAFFGGTPACANTNPKTCWRPFRAPASCTPWAPQHAAKSTSSCKRTFSALQKTVHYVLCPCAGVKLLVFAHHTAVLDAIQGACLTGQLGRRGVRIDGGTPAAARKQGVDEFQNSDGCRVALLSITAAGVSFGYGIFVIHRFTQ